MHNILLFPLTVAAFAALLMSAPAAPVPKDAGNPDPVYYPTKKGAKWVYTTDGTELTKVVTGVEREGAKTIVSVATERGDTVVPFAKYAVLAEGVFHLETGGSKLDSPSCLVRSPHKDGQVWDNSFTVNGQDYKGRRTAHGSEQVKVPAGTFLAVRVEVAYTLNGNPRTVTFWYAPGVGLVKQVAGNVIQELKLFTPGKD